MQNHPDGRGLVAICCILALSIAGSAYEAVYAKSEQPRPPISQREPKKVQAESGNNTNSSANDAIADYTFWLMVFTGVLAGSTIGLWWVTWCISSHTKRAFISSERAFIFKESFTPYAIHDSDGKIKSWRFFPIWKNCGNTPTKHALTHISKGIYDAPIADDFTFPDIWKDDIQTALLPVFIGPKHTIMGEFAEFSVDDLAAA